MACFVLGGRAVQASVRTARPPTDVRWRAWPQLQWLGTVKVAVAVLSVRSLSSSAKGPSMLIAASGFLRTWL